MRAMFGGFGLIVVAGLLAGCGGGAVTPENLPPEQKAPDYGQKSLEEMNKVFPKKVEGGQSK